MKKIERGFTLIELLIVISIIVTLMAVGSFGITNFSKSRGPHMAATEAQGMFSLAKLEAIAKGTFVRVLIHAENDPNNTLHRERYLKYITIQSLNRGPNERRDTPAGAPEPLEDDFWEITQRGQMLSKNAWFIPSLSNQTDLTIPTVYVRLPGQSEGELSRCYYYEFNSQGIIRDPKPGAVAPRFIVSGGSMPPGNVEPIRKDKNVAGFVIWRNGTTSQIQHPEQIGL